MFVFFSCVDDGRNYQLAGSSSNPASIINDNDENSEGYDEQYLDEDVSSEEDDEEYIEEYLEIEETKDKPSGLSTPAASSYRKKKYSQSYRPEYTQKYSWVTQKKNGNVTTYEQTFLN